MTGKSPTGRYVSVGYEPVRFDAECTEGAEKAPVWDEAIIDSHERRAPLDDFSPAMPIHLAS